MKSSAPKRPVTSTPTKEILPSNLKSCEEHQAWLKLHAEPITEIIIKWNETFAYRNRMIQDKNIDEILLGWPLFKNSKADLLVS